MTIENKIKATDTYKRLVASTPFLENILLKKATKDNIERYIYQLKAFGMDYLDDKNYSEREVKIAKEIINSEV